MEKEYPVRLYEHLDEREWTADDMNRIARLIASTDLIGEQVVLEVLEIQQDVDERIDAEIQHDRWALGRDYGRTYEPTLFESPDSKRWDVC